MKWKNRKDAFCYGINSVKGKRRDIEKVHEKHGKKHKHKCYSIAMSSPADSQSLNTRGN